LGQIYRTHSHIRTVAQRMLDSHRTPLEPEKAQAIVNALAEETKSHGHAISRSEAEKLGLRIIRPSEELEGAIWALFESYEIASQMRDPLDPLTILGARDEADIRIVIAWGPVRNLVSASRIW